MFIVWVSNNSPVSAAVVYNLNENESPAFKPLKLILPEKGRFDRVEDTPVLVLIDSRLMMIGMILVQFLMEYSTVTV